MHGSALLPVLARRHAVVDVTFKTMFPNLVSTNASVSNLSGWAAGRAAADVARLGVEQPVLPGVAI